MPMQQMLLGASGAAGLNVGDVFNTTVFTANGSTGQTLTTGIDLATEGGMVWHKDRDATYQHVIWDSARGNGEYFVLPSQAESKTNLPDSCSFNTNGHTLDAALGNEGTNSTVAWSFRKAEKFFDIQKWDGDSEISGNDAKQISHNLGCKVGFAIIKCTSHSSTDWLVWHTYAGLGQNVLKLNGNDAASSSNYIFYGGAGSGYAINSSTQFGNLGPYDFTNETGKSYVAYLFAEDEDIIKCGTTSSISGYGTETIQLGWKPQFLLVKPVTNSGNWLMADSERGLYTSVSSTAKALYPNTTDDEETVYDSVAVHDNGFIIKDYTGSTGTYLYVAIKEE